MIPLPDPRVVISFTRAAAALRAAAWVAMRADARREDDAEQRPVEVAEKLHLLPLVAVALAVAGGGHRHNRAPHA